MKSKIKKALEQIPDIVMILFVISIVLSGMWIIGCAFWEIIKKI